MGRRIQESLKSPLSALEITNLTMLHSTSVKTRFLVSVGANGLRGVIGLASGLLIGRGLNPSGYGDLMFLLGSFVAVRSLLDMGTSNAFYTFLSRHTQGRRFYLSYFVWMALQFAITLSLVALLIPDSVFEKIWLGHNRGIVITAFLAAFMQQQVWQVVNQIGESMRKTIKVQLLNLFIAITYLATILILLAMGSMSLENILLLLIVQYAFAAQLAYRFLKEEQAWPVEEDVPFKSIAMEYWVYCKPLIGLSLVTFLYFFADKWMLQKFGGASQQGFFQIANQFSTISLLATTSILSIFWKEIANALANNDHTRVAMLYHKVSRGLVMLSAIIAGLLIPWSEQIVMIFLGQAYAQAWPVLAIMLLYPILQSMGQIGGAMLLASGNTTKHAYVTLASMLVSVPLSYLMLAPTTGVLVPGMGMGALGMAIKMVLLAIASVNIQAWVVARYGGWKFDWTLQAVGIPLMVGLGFLVKIGVGLLWNLGGNGIADLIVPFVLAFFVYTMGVVTLLWQLPWLIGMDREGLLSLLGKLKGRYSPLRGT